MMDDFDKRRIMALRASRKRPERALQRLLSGMPFFETIGGVLVPVTQEYRAEIMEETREIDDAIASIRSHSKAY